MRITLAFFAALLGVASGSPSARAQTPAPATPAVSDGVVSEGTAPFFVYCGSYRGKQAAQEQARAVGGWVLRTDIFTDLTPGFFAAVHGPYETRAQADEALARLAPTVPEAFVRAAGASRLPEGLGDPALLAALLGEVTVTVHEDVDRDFPCAPRERHLTVLLGYATTRISNSAGNAPAGGFWIIDRTGEVIPIRPCDSAAGTRR